MGTPCIICGQTDTRKLFDKGGRDFIRCGGCGLVRVDPLPTHQENKHYYDETYREWYSTFHRATDIRRLIAEHRMDEVESFARPGHWLDVGCAAGQFVALARERGIDAEGLDIAPAAIEQAQAQGIPAHLGSIEEFSPPRQYDTITAFDVLEHTIEPIDFLHGCAPGRCPTDPRPDPAGRQQRLPATAHAEALVPLPPQRPSALLRSDHRPIAARATRLRVEKVSRAYKP